MGVCSILSFWDVRWRERHCMLDGFREDGKIFENWDCAFGGDGGGCGWVYVAGEMLRRGWFLAWYLEWVLLLWFELEVGCCGFDPRALISILISFCHDFRLIYRGFWRDSIRLSHIVLVLNSEFVVASMCFGRLCQISILNNVLEAWLLRFHGPIELNLRVKERLFLLNPALLNHWLFKVLWWFVFIVIRD